jgi:hypothetical protein
METNVFEAKLTTFMQTIKKWPLLLIFDGHRTHEGMGVIKLARDNQIAIVKLPSHTSDKLQPLDESCFRPLKNEWYKKLSNYQRDNGFRQISKAESVDLLCDVWLSAMTPANIKSGFLKTGIFPYCQ